MKREYQTNINNFYTQPRLKNIEQSQVLIAQSRGVFNQFYQRDQPISFKYDQERCISRNTVSNNNDQQAISHLRNQITTLKSEMSKLIEKGSTIEQSDVRSPPKVVNYELRQLPKLHSVINMPIQMKRNEKKPQSPDFYQNQRNVQIEFCNNTQKHKITRINPVYQQMPININRGDLSKSGIENANKFNKRMSFYEERPQIVVKHVSLEQKIIELESILKERESACNQYQIKFTERQNRQKQLNFQLGKLKNQVKDLQNLLADQKQNMALKNVIIQRILNENTEMNLKISSFNHEIFTLKSKHQEELRFIADKAQGQKHILKCKIQELSFKLQQSEINIQKLKMKASQNCQLQAKQFDKKMKQLIDQNNDFRKRVDSYKKSLELMNCSNNSTRDKQVLLKQQNRILQQELQDKEKLINSLYSDIKILDEEIRNLHGSKSIASILSKHIDQLNQQILTTKISQLSFKYKQ